MKCQSCGRLSRALNQHNDCIRCSSGQPFKHEQTPETALGPLLDARDTPVQSDEEEEDASAAEEQGAIVPGALDAGDAECESPRHVLKNKRLGDVR